MSLGICFCFIGLMILVAAVVATLQHVVALQHGKRGMA
jgi:hypothetical protein